MALGTNKGYYKRSDDIIKRRLKMFDIWYKKCLKDGFTEKKAEEIAYQKARVVR